MPATLPACSCERPKGPSPGTCMGLPSAGQVSTLVRFTDADPESKRSEEVATGPQLGRGWAGTQPAFVTCCCATR